MNNNIKDILNNNIIINERKRTIQISDEVYLDFMVFRKIIDTLKHLYVVKKDYNNRIIFLKHSDIRKRLDFMLNNDFKNTFDYYPTPKKLINKMIRFAFKDTKLINKTEISFLEPNAGKGNIIISLSKYLKRFKIKFKSKLCIEIDKEHFSDLIKINKNSLLNDFLLLDIKEKFDLILLNPPFRNESKQMIYHKHIFKAFNLLNDEGVLVSIIPLSFLNLNSNDKIDFFNFLKEYNYEIIDNKSNDFMKF